MLVLRRRLAPCQGSHCAVCLPRTPSSRQCSVWPRTVSGALDAASLLVRRSRRPHSAAPWVKTHTANGRRGCALWSSPRDLALFSAREKRPRPVTDTVPCWLLRHYTLMPCESSWIGCISAQELDFVRVAEARELCARVRPETRDGPAGWPSSVRYKEAPVVRSEDFHISNTFFAATFHSSTDTLYF
jgi:hypothetical protein